jgi:flagellar motor protein MotB
MLRNHPILRHSHGVYTIAIATPCWSCYYPPSAKEIIAMPRLSGFTSLFVLISVALIGCADNPMVLKGKVTQYEQQQLALQRQNSELQNRANSLDKDNQEYSQLLAQSRQQSKVFEDQLTALRDQLRTTTTQLAQARSEKETTDKKVQAMTTSLQRQGGMPITPNNSLLQSMPATNIPDVNVRRDGDVIRVELPCHRLFESGTTRLRSGGPELIVSAATELLRTYPDQIIGIEGHTDNDPVNTGQWRSNHELSIARAMAVYDVIITRTRLQGDQLFVVGHGSNHPVVSNATPDGKQRNRRVEFVVYPERRGE